MQHAHGVKKTVFALIIGGALFVNNMFDLLPPINWAIALLTLGVLIYSGGHFFVGAWNSFLQHAANMDTLIALGTGIAWLYSCVVLLFLDQSPSTAQNVYFASTCMIIAFVNLGSIFELKAHRDTMFKALHIGDNTVSAQIVQMVQAAQDSKPALAKLADRVAAIFVPLVMIIAIVTALIWFNANIEPRGIYMLVTSVSVLIIACPCALGLAVPIAVMVGIGNAAKHGILIRHADAFQQTCKLTTILLDKTGTITQGQPRIIDILSEIGYNKQELLAIAASLEVGSEHPYATAIINAAAEQQIALKPVTNFKAIAGLGVNGTIGEEAVALGNAEFMQAQLINVDALREQTKQCAAYGQTAIYVGKNKRLIGLLSIADPIKPDAKYAIEKLQKMNLKVIMITGDQYATAQAIAQRVGISDMIAGVMPQEKVAKIIQLQEQGEIVAMVGDGINDAPALAQANVGIAIGTGTDIAMQSADITLLHGSLTNIVDTITISHQTVANMRQNLFAAFIYNIIGIPIAAGILFPFTGWLLSPMIAGAAMALSSFIVVSNAMRLKQ